jgi:type IV pilus assembly protein PilQ
MKNNKARNISNPRILVTNGQESVIDLTQDYIKTIKTEMNSGSGGFSTIAPTVTRTVETDSDLGIRISVTPFISPDGFVYMNLKPEYTTVSGREYAPSIIPGAQDLLATLLKKNNLDLKNVRVKDGDTLVLAGMISELETKGVSKVPFLGDIPGIGTFFRSTETQKTRSELVILITPKIITDDENPANYGESTL